MEWNYVEMLLKILAEKIEQLQDENFMLRLENDCLKKEAGARKSLVKGGTSHEKNS
jgi:regulator of replication initiation timing